MQLPVMLCEQSLQHTIQTIRLKRYNLQTIRRFCAEHALDADLDEAVDGVQFFSTAAALHARVGWWRHVRPLLRPFGIEILEGEEEMREHLRLRPGATLNAYGAVRLRHDFDTICAARFVIGAVREAASAGAHVHVHTHTRVLRIEPATAAGGECTIHTDRGAVRCKKVVVATNGYIGSLIPALADKIRPIRNHVLVTSPAPWLLKDGSRCGMGGQNGFAYWIQREDGRIVLGGFRDREPGCGVDQADDSKEAEDPQARAAIRSFLWDHFDLGGAEPPVCIEQEWTGIIGWSCDDMPWVGPLPGQPGIFVCAGYCGSGLSRAFACGVTVAEMICGEAQPTAFVAKFLPDWSRSWTADLEAGHAVSAGARDAHKDQSISKGKAKL